MKKLTLTLIVLALVCTGVFAAKSVTAGLAYGGYIIPMKLDLTSDVYDTVYDLAKPMVRSQIASALSIAENAVPDANLETETKKFATPYASMGNLGFVYDMGPGLFAGFDYVKENGLTIYDDLAINLAAKDNGEKVAAKKYFTLSEYAGLGYTFYKNKFAFMAGAGLEAKIGLGLKNVFGEGAKFALIGAGLRGKVSYAINEQFSVSVQGNAAFDFKVISTIPDYDLDAALAAAQAAEHKAPATEAAIAGAVNRGLFQNIMGEAKFVSGNLFIGCTYNF